MTGEQDTTPPVRPCLKSRRSCSAPASDRLRLLPLLTATPLQSRVLAAGCEDVTWACTHPLAVHQRVAVVSPNLSFQQQPHLSITPQHALRTP